MVIFIGPCTYPVTGQAMAFKYLVENYSSPKKVFMYGANSDNLFSVSLATLSVFMSLFFFLLTHREVSAFYLTTSRTKFGFFRDCLFILTAKSFGLKVCNHLHGADFKEFRSNSHRLIKHIIDYVYVRIDVSIVLLPRMREQYDMYPSMKVVSVNNCSEAVHFSRNDKLGAGCLNLLYLSNIMYSKGILHLIEAVDNLVLAGHGIELYIAGQIIADEYRSVDEIRLQFETLSNGKSYIKYLGVVEGDTKKRLLNHSDIFVLPTFYKTEAQPISVIEAMMAGLPIITTDHNYMSDLVTSESGLRVRTKSVAQLEAAILKLKSAPLLMASISNYNKESSASKFSVEQYVSSISNVLDEMQEKY